MTSGKYALAVHAHAEACALWEKRKPLSLFLQRDVAWASVPEPVRAAAAATPKLFEPVRVIESKQAAGGVVVYELFAAPAQEGAPAGGPAMAVRWHEKAEVIP